MVLLFDQMKVMAPLTMIKLRKKNKKILRNTVPVSSDLHSIAAKYKQWNCIVIFCNLKFCSESAVGDVVLINYTALKKNLKNKQWNIKYI